MRLPTEVLDIGRPANVEIIFNRPHPPPDGIKVAIFYTKLHNRLLRPLLAADQPPAPPELPSALRIIDQQITSYITCARLSDAE